MKEDHHVPTLKPTLGTYDFSVHFIFLFPITNIFVANRPSVCLSNKSKSDPGQKSGEKKKKKKNQEKGGNDCGSRLIGTNKTFQESFELGEFRFKHI